MEQDGTNDKSRGAGRAQFRESYAPSIGSSWFLGIGINEYNQFPRLHNAVKDVKDLIILMQDQYGLEPHHTITLFDEEATRNNIIDKLEKLSSEIKATDSLLIYYSGHGYLNSSTQLAYWIPQNAEQNRTGTYLENSTIRNYIRSIPSRHTLLISDSCFSGTLFVRGVKRSILAANELEQRRSRWGLVSGRENEEVYDGEPGTNSPFAESILQVLEHNRLDKLNIARLADQVIEMTRSRYRQLPEGNPLFDVGHDGGQYIFRWIGGEGNFWDSCKRAASLQAYSEYLEKFPAGAHVDEALAQIRLLEEKENWEKALRQNTIFTYQSFLRRFPDGEFSNAAKDRIRDLQFKEQDSEEFEVWNLAKAKNNKSSYQDYLSRYPDGQFSGQANELIQGLETVEVGQNAKIDPQEVHLTNEIKEKDKRKRRFSSIFPILVLLAVSIGFFLIYLAYGSGRAGGIETTDLTNETSLTLASPEIINLQLNGGVYPTIQTKQNGLIWMAKNLDIEAEESICYSKQSDNCDSFGQLYRWRAAEQTCASLGDGWRLPSLEEWKSLIRFYLNGDTTLEGSTYEAITSSNFQGLLGGMRAFGPDNFFDINQRGFYWTSSLYDEGQATGNYAIVELNKARKSVNFRTTPGGNVDYLSCRCVKRPSLDQNSQGDLSAVQNKEEKLKKSTKYAILGGKTYPVLAFDQMLWLGKNLDYRTRNESWCYNQQDSFCIEYGRLYTRAAAEQACQALGEHWRLPKKEDWIQMLGSFGTVGVTNIEEDTMLIVRKSPSGGNAYKYQAIKDKSFPGLAPKEIRKEIGKVYYSLRTGGSSSFEAQLGGAHSNYEVSQRFFGAGENGYYWVGETFSPDFIFFSSLDNLVIYYDAYLGLAFDRIEQQVDPGYSCRCVKDTSVEEKEEARASQLKTKLEKWLKENSKKISLAGVEYPVLEFNQKSWLGKNLDYDVGPESWCYNEQESTCAKYGRLYTWTAATKACQALGRGWRLPTEKELQTFIQFCEDQRLDFDGIYESEDTLTATSIISTLHFPLNGYRTEKEFSEYTKFGYYWSSSVNSDHTITSPTPVFRSETKRKEHFDELRRLRNLRWIYTYQMTDKSTSSTKTTLNENYGLSCRCVKDF